MEEEITWASKLADEWYIILFAYVAAFLPWTVVSATDFISSTWKPVYVTRRNGHINLIFIILPALYIVFYIYLQANSKDYKEMFAAIVALLFSILHCLRTIWGLWQLSIFHSWAAKSIRSLELLDIHHEHPFSKLSPKEIANDLLVNDTLIDNQLFHGSTKCYLQYAEQTFKLDIDRGGNLWYRILLLFRRILSLPFRLVLDSITRIWGHSPPNLRQVPHDPVEVWLNWSVAFAAQELSGWIRDFAVASDPSREDESGRDRRTASKYFQRKRDYFAGRVLASAVMHLWPEKTSLPFLDHTSMYRESPMMWESWDDSSDVAYGCLSKNELLRNAVRSGEGLPFGAKQFNYLFDDDDDDDDDMRKKKEETINVIIEAQGYAMYAGKLKRVTESMPTNFGPDIERFDVERLEWLTIFLNLGHTLQTMTKTPTKDTSTMVTEESVSESSHDTGSTVLSTDQERVDDDDLAMINLRMQLGFGVEDAAETAPDHGITSVNSFGTYSLSAFPFPPPLLLCIRSAHVQLYENFPPANGIRNYFSLISPANRLTTVAGELIDMWLALLAGHQYNYMLEIDGKWEQRCLGKGKQTLPGVRTTPLHSRTNEALRTMHKRAEKARLAYQFSAVRNAGSYEHMDQTLAFMGLGMEYVRSNLAHWVHHNSTQIQDAWTPQLFPQGERVTEWQEIRGTDFDAFGFLSISADDHMDEYIHRRSVQVRFMYEFQRLLRERIDEESERIDVEGAPPSSLLLIMCAIMSFPSIEIKHFFDADSSTSLEVVRWVDETTRACCTGINLSRFNMKKNDRYAFETMHKPRFLYIKPVCAPQQLKILVRIMLNDNDDTFSVQARLEREDANDESCNNFEWEWWRDAAMSRLEGLQQWQQAHDFPALDLNITNTTIRQGTRELSTILRGTGNSFLTWCGWEPFRFEICRYELESPGFLLHFESVRGLRMGGMRTYRRQRLPRTTRIVYNYKQSNRAELRHGCFVVRDVMILDKGKSEDECTAQIKADEECAAQIKTDDERTAQIERDDKHARRLITQADDLLKNNHAKNFDHAVLLLEVAAVELESLDALRKCVKLLAKHGHTMNNSAWRAARMIQLYFNKAPCNRREIESDDIPKCEEGSSKYLSIFEDLAVADGFEQVVPHFSDYLSHIVEKDTKWSISRWFCWLRRMFLYTQESDLLEVMATTMRCSRVHRAVDTNVDLSGEDCGHVSDAKDAYVSERDRQTALNVLSRKIYDRATCDDEHVTSMIELGVMLMEGAECVPKDIQGGLGMFTRAKDQHSIIAMNHLAKVYETGAEGVGQNVVMAVRYYKRALKIGAMMEACDAVFMLISCGNRPFGGLVQPDPRAELRARGGIGMLGESLQLFSTLGVIDLETFGLGLKYFAFGIPFLRIRMNAIRNALLSVVQKRPVIKEMLTDAKESGMDEGIIFNLGDVLEEMKKGALVETMYNLGVVLKRGYDGGSDVGWVQADKQGAAKLFKGAVEREMHVESMYELGVIWEEVDMDTAREFYRWAYRTGEHEGALQRLREIEKGVSGDDMVRRGPEGDVDVEEVKHMDDLLELLERPIEGIEEDAADVP